MQNRTSSLEHENNLAHFTAMVYMAQVDGQIKKEEIALLKLFADKMGLGLQEYEYIISNPSRPSVSPSTSTGRRLRRIFDMFKIVFANHNMNGKERLFLYRYALQIGFCKNNARKVIDKSTAMFTGNFEFEDYNDFVKR
ncbi:hypothetical protein DHD05_15195 [Arenibacter sp. N53]|uniref:hypothetical protein n=1 Tax=Arenibacter TaxID=178469 RepID=UPI000CD48C74|nr:MULTISPECIES: hypothetical protein [Arenibacter]MCM4152936.1 hypothetical protein [Arenibacter sp. N53]